MPQVIISCIQLMLERIALAGFTVLALVALAIEHLEQLLLTLQPRFDMDFCFKICQAQQLVVFIYNITGSNGVVQGLRRIF